jgi:hypothetical protein
MLHELKDAELDHPDYKATDGPVVSTGAFLNVAEFARFRTRSEFLRIRYIRIGYAFIM